VAYWEALGTWKIGGPGRSNAMALLANFRPTPRSRERAQSDGAVPAQQHVHASLMQHSSSDSPPSSAQQTAGVTTLTATSITMSSTEIHRPRVAGNTGGRWEFTRSRKASRASSIGAARHKLYSLTTVRHRARHGVSRSACRSQSLRRGWPVACSGDLACPDVGRVHEWPPVLRHAVDGRQQLPHDEQRTDGR
jgi:hypothetical protein